MPEYSISQLGTFEECAIQYRLMLAPDGAFEIHDYKTGSSLPDQAEREFAPDFRILGDQYVLVRISASSRHRRGSSRYVA